MRLTDRSIKSLRPKDRPYKIYDGEGMYLRVTPTGAKYWRMKVVYRGKEDTLAFGVYPKVSLAEARKRREDAQKAIAAGRNPRHTVIDKESQKFSAFAKKWFDTHTGVWSKRYADTVWHRLEVYVFPKIGNMDATLIEAQDILTVITPLSARGKVETAKRVLRYINGIFAYTIVVLGQLRYSPDVGLHITIKRAPVKHNPHLTEEELPSLIKKLYVYPGVVGLAARFLLLTMTRTSEVRFVRIGEVDFKKKLWTIPAERMKMKREHVVPLSNQAIEVLKEAGEYDGDYLFPSPTRKGRALSENAILYALYEMGYKGKLTGHGFRGTASTVLNERGYDKRVIDAQLAHKDTDRVSASYNHAEFIAKRRQLLQDWADILDDLGNSL